MNRGYAGLLRVAAEPGPTSSEVRRGACNGFGSMSVPLEQRPSRIHKRTARYKREAKALGMRVRELRHELGWTLEEAAGKCDVDWKHIQKIEAGRINVTLVTLVRLAGCMKKPLFAFFSPPELVPPRRTNGARRNGDAMPRANGAKTAKKRARPA